MLVSLLGLSNFYPVPIYKVICSSDRLWLTFFICCNCISDTSVERGCASHPLHSLYQMSCTPGMNGADWAAWLNPGGLVQQWAVLTKMTIWKTSKCILWKSQWKDKTFFVNFTIIIFSINGLLVTLLSCLSVSVVCSHGLTAILLLAVQLQKQLNGPPSLP